MRLTTTLARRSLIGRPGRTVFSILGIAVGVATVVAIFALDHNTLKSRSARGGSDWQAEIEISPSVVVADPRAELGGVAGLTDVTAAFQHQVALWRDGVDKPRNLHLVALEATDAPRLGAYQLRAGRHLDPGATEPEVLVGPAVSEEHGIAPGDRIELSRPRRAPRRTCVEGEWRELQNEPQELPLRRTFVVAGVLEREGVGRRGRGAVAVLDYDVGLSLFDGTNVQTRYWARRDPTVDIERTEKLLSSAWSYELQKSVIVGQAADERAFRNGVRFAGLLALVLGLFVIFYTLSRSLLERVREVGTLHALGATRAQVARVFLVEALVIAGAGGVLGLLGGLGLAIALLRAGITTLGRRAPIETFEIPWALALPLAAIGVGIALLGSIYPLLRARRLSTVAALRGEEQGGVSALQRGFHLFAAVLLAIVLPVLYFAIVPVVGELGEELLGVILTGLAVLGAFVCLPLVVPSVLGAVSARIVQPFERRWPLSGFLAARGMIAGSARVAGAISALALVVAGYVALRGMTRSLEAEIEVWGQEAFVDKLFVRDLPTVDFDLLAEELTGLPGVLGVEPCDVRHYVPFLVVGLEPELIEDYGPCADDPELLARFTDGRGVFLSRRLADHIGKSVGAELHVTNGAGRVESLPVLAVTDAYGYSPHPDERLYGCASRDVLRDLFCLDVATAENVAVRLSSAAAIEPVRAAVLEHLARAPREGGAGAGDRAAAVRFETGGEVYSWHASDIERDFLLFDVILALTAALAVLGILNGQLLAALERTKELGILRALGSDRRQVAGMVLLESLVVGLLGGALGCALGAALDPVIVEALRTISGLPLPQRGPGLALLVGLAGALGVAVVAALYPIWRMNRQSAVAAVRAPG